MSSERFPLRARLVMPASIGVVWSEFLSRLLYVSIVGQSVGALVLLPPPPALVLFGLATFVVGVGVFLGVARTSAPVMVHAPEAP